MAAEEGGAEKETNKNHLHVVYFFGGLGGIKNYYEIDPIS